MGICLDTERNNDTRSSFEESGGGQTWAGGTPNAVMVGTPPAGKFPMQNTSHVKFEAPRVPVIFVLGGPGSGKVTHCDNLMQEKRGIVHINMTDLLQQYAIGNEMQDFGSLSSKTVTEVLMLEMKMAPAAKTYLVSGYPRSMRDIAEYSDKIQIVNGVILVSWRQKILERQIDYGAKLGHVVLSLARMELNNFYRSVMPVADYFDQSDMLIAINGERNPAEVYKDFRSAVLRILGTQEERPAIANGVTRPAENVLSEVAADEPTPVPVALPIPPPPALPETILPSPPPMARNDSHIDMLPPMPAATLPLILPQPESNRSEEEPVPSDMPFVCPPVVWVIGGPGSNKAALCQRAVAQMTGWTHFSLGGALRALGETGGPDGAAARASVSAGELASRNATEQLVRRSLQRHVANATRNTLHREPNKQMPGVVIDGYPRDLEQMDDFENEYGVSPRTVLLDCSKLQLGRGRRDDGVAAFRRRLELFREKTLPMLRALDAQQRLIIVDGDTDSATVQEEFNRIMLNEMQFAEVAPPPARMTDFPESLTRRRPALTGEEQPPDLTSMPVDPSAAVAAVGRQVASQVATLANGVKHMANGLANGAIPNGVLPNGVAGKATTAVNQVQAKFGALVQENRDAIRGTFSDGI